MATTFQTLETPLEIPARPNKIIRLERLIQAIHGSVIGSKVLRVRSNAADVFPNVLCQNLLDLSWTDHQPQGARGASVVIEVPGNEALISVWVAYRYVD